MQYRAPNNFGYVKQTNKQRENRKDTQRAWTSHRPKTMFAKLVIVKGNIINGCAS